MTRPQYAPVPRGYVRVWVLYEHGPDVHGLPHSHIYATQAAADREASWLTDGCDVTPLDIPAGAVPGLGTTKKARKRGRRK